MPAPVVVVGTNSWASVAEADAYFGAKYGAAAWAALSLMEKTQLLISACRWLMQQTSLALSLSDASSTLKDAQCETAWFLLNWQTDYDKRRALISSGVRSYRVLDFSESLTEVTFPKYLSDMLVDYATSPGTYFPRVDRNLEDNASE